MQKFLLTVEDISIHGLPCMLHGNNSGILAEYRIRHGINAGEPRLEVCNEHLANQLEQYSAAIALRR